MRSLVLKKLFKIVSTALTIAAIFPTSLAFADSMYDGIWQLTTDHPNPQYYVITMTGNTVVVIGLFEVALYRKPLHGTYIGTLPAISHAEPSPDHPLTVRVVTDRAPIYNDAWKINFISKELATMQNAQEASPVVSSPPIMSLRKIF